MKQQWRPAVFALLCLMVSAGTAWGQGSVGTLNGTILDAQGAVVPGATVVAINQATNVETKTTSTSAGAYTLPYLPAGTYTIRANAPGFRTASAENVILRVAQTLTVNITLEVGQITEQVTVSDTPPLLESGTAEIGRYISVDEYKSWPIFVDDGQRQIQQFIFSSLPGTTGGTFKGSINGGQEYSHEILIEGIPVGRSDLSGGNNNEMSPSAEAIGEFKLQAGAITAQYNGGQTAVANFSIKSGTNDLHGSAFWYHQNEALNSLSLSEHANKGAAEAAGREFKKNPYREHNYGYSLGGPVYIPKVYDGRNKTFFFTNFEKDKLKQLRFSGFATLATPDFKRGDFSRLFDPSYTGNGMSGTQIGTDALGRPIVFGQIYDPHSTRTAPDGSTIRDPFPGNIIPKSLWSPVSTNIIEKVGVVDPTIDRMVNNIERVATCCPFFNLHIIGVKGDHNLTDKHRLSGYYNHGYRGRNNNGGSRYLPIPGPPTSSWQDQFTPSRMVRLSLNSTVTATVLNRIAAGYNRFRNTNGALQRDIDKDWAGQIGIQNTSPAFFPVMAFGGSEVQGGRIARMGVGYAGESFNGSWVAQDDLTWIKGEHTFRFGYEFKRYYYNDRDRSGSGSYQFRPRQTALSGYLNETGHAFASFLLGAAQSASRNIVGMNPGFRQPQHGFYVMDDWKMSPKLTLNLGFRWEIIPPFYEVTGRLSYADLSAANPEAGGLLGAMVFNRKPHKTYWKELGPRLGFAYQVNNKMVVRGGYAITNTPPIRNDWGYGGFTYGFSAGIPVNTPLTQFPDDPAIYLHDRFPDFRGTLPNANPGVANFDSVTTTASDAQRPGYVQNWNLTIQYQLPQDTVLELAYIGNKGTRLWGGVGAYSEYNGLPASLMAHGDILQELVGDHPTLKPYADYPDDVPVSQALRKYPHYYGVNEAFPYNTNSSYNALQVTLTRHLTRGLGFLAAYTWSKTLSYVDSNGPGAYYAYGQVQDYFNRRLDRSVAAFHLPHSFKLTWVYELPFGKGRTWDLGWANYALGGWVFSAIQNFRSGFPLEVTQSGIASPPGFAPGIRPDVTGANPTLGDMPEKADFYNSVPHLNPAAWSPSPRTGNGVPLRVGTGPRYYSYARGPHAVGEDFSMKKKFPIPVSETMFFQLGFVMSNPFNRTGRDWASWRNNIDDSEFGRILQVGGGKTVQIEARVEW